MFKLSLDDIKLGLVSAHKTQVIKDIALALVSAGYVEEGYADGMLKREQQTTTYLGNGIAIPHGTLDTRLHVKQTGIKVFQYPEGVVWGDEGQRVYIVIGIAAKSDEHLALLRQLTSVLGEPDIENKLASIKTAEQLHAILSGERNNAGLLLEPSLISLNVDTDNLLTLQALNASLLQKAQAVESKFIADVVSHLPTYLGHGIWLSDSNRGNLLSAMAIARPVTAFTEHEKPVRLLITASMSNQAMKPVLYNFARLLLNHKTDDLFIENAQGLISLLEKSQIISQEGLSAEFTVVNPHGLHTRPGSILVKVVKEFNSTITVVNLDGSGKEANASSLMKVVGLGAKKGDRLRFTAVGNDAKVALEAIGKAMADGLGEGAE